MNPSVATSLEAAGMKLVGRNNDGTGERMEVLELEEERHPYFMGAQVCSGVCIEGVSAQRWIYSHYCRST